MKLFAYIRNFRKARSMQAILRREFPEMNIECRATASDIWTRVICNGTHDVSIGGRMSERRDSRVLAGFVMQRVAELRNPMLKRDPTA